MRTTSFLIIFFFLIEIWKFDIVFTVEPYRQSNVIFYKYKKFLIAKQKKTKINHFITQTINREIDVRGH